MIMSHWMSKIYIGTAVYVSGRIQTICLSSRTRHVHSDGCHNVVCHVYVYNEHEIIEKGKDKRLWSSYNTCILTIVIILKVDNA